MQSKSHNIGDRVIENLFESLFNRCQIGLETSMRSSDFIFHWVYLLHYNCYKIHFKQNGSYVDSTDWIKIKKYCLMFYIVKTLYVYISIYISISIYIYTYIYIIYIYIYSAYISKHNSNREKQAILSMITNREGWYYIAVKQLAALLRA